MKVTAKRPVPDFAADLYLILPPMMLFRLLPIEFLDRRRMW